MNIKVVIEGEPDKAYNLNDLVAIALDVLSAKVHLSSGYVDSNGKEIFEGDSLAVVSAGGRDVCYKVCNGPYGKHNCGWYAQDLHGKRQRPLPPLLIGKTACKSVIVCNPVS